MNIERKGKSVDEHVSDMVNKVSAGMSTGIKAISADAKLLVGVDTGRLRNSIFDETTKDGLTVTGAVGSDVEYAFFHSLQNPYLENAVDRNLQLVTLAIAKEVAR